MGQQIGNMVSTKLSDNILYSVKEIANERKQKTDDIIREAIEIYVTEWTDYKIAIDRLNNSSDPVLTENEFLKEMGWDI